ncbi:MAG: hypothetical protein PWP67_895 [Clostridium butyricum]|jgi:hypothetical protein|nr:hypothetical protein [Clostridium butyricum]
MEEKVNKEETQRIYKLYNNFIRNVEIVDVYILDSKINRKLLFEDMSKNLKLHYTDKIEYKLFDKKIIYKISFNLKTEPEDEFKIEMDLAITYILKSELDSNITDDEKTKIFELFKRNAKLNGWPYIRTYVNDFTSKMSIHIPPLPVSYL